MAMFDEIGQLLGSGPALGQVSKLLGADETQSKGLLSKAVPLLLGSIGKRASSEAGGSAIFDMVKGNDGSVLNDIGGFLGGGDQGGVGSALVGSLLGSRQGAAESGLASETGMGVGAVTKFLPMLAPLVMGFLGKKQSETGMDKAGLLGALSGEKSAMEAGGLGSILGLLDGGDDAADEAGFASGISKLAGLGGLGAMGAGMVGGLGDKVGGITGNLPGGLGDKAGDLTGGISDGLSGGVSGVTGAAGDLTGNLGDKAAGLTGGVTGAAGDLTGKVGDMAAGAAGKVGGVGGAAAVAGGAGAMAAGGASKITGAASNVTKGATGAVGGAARSVSTAGAGVTGGYNNDNDGSGLKKFLPLLLIGLIGLGLLAWWASRDSDDGVVETTATTEAAVETTEAMEEEPVETTEAMEEEVMEEVVEGWIPGNIMDTASQAGNLGGFVGAVEAAGLGGALEGEGPLTVFAPTDEALAALPASITGDKATLERVLKNHVVAGNITSADLAEGALDNLAGGKLNVALGSGSPTINGANVVQADVGGANGSLHIIDTVLLPADLVASSGGTLNDVLGIKPINFDTGSANIAADSTATLDEAAAFLIDLNAPVEIGGHTDSDGGEASNQALSQARADAVMAYLIGKGVDAGNLTAVGYGEGTPIADNATSEGKAANRRIEFVAK